MGPVLLWPSKGQISSRGNRVEAFPVMGHKPHCPKRKCFRAGMLQLYTVGHRPSPSSVPGAWTVFDTAIRHQEAGENRKFLPCLLHSLALTPTGCLSDSRLGAFPHACCCPARLLGDLASDWSPPELLLPTLGPWDLCLFLEEETTCFWGWVWSMAVSFRCPLTFGRKYFLRGAAFYAMLPTRTFCCDGNVLFLLYSVWQPHVAGNCHIGQMRVPIHGYIQDKVKIKGSLLGTIPSLSLLGPLWIIVRCHWVKLIFINQLYSLCCFQVLLICRYPECSQSSSLALLLLPCLVDWQLRLNYFLSLLYCLLIYHFKALLNSSLS